MMKRKSNNFLEKRDLPIKENSKISIKSCTSKWNFKTPEKSYKESVKSSLILTIITMKIEFKKIKVNHY